MSEVKKATTYEEQMALLKSRGLRITDEEACLRKLSLINYYRLTAYLIPFKDDATGNYVQGALLLIKFTAYMNLTENCETLFLEPWKLLKYPCAPEYLTFMLTNMDH